MTDPPYDTSDLTPEQAEAAFLVDASPGPNGVTPWTEGVLSAEQVQEIRDDHPASRSIPLLARSHEQLRRERDAALDREYGTADALDALLAERDEARRREHPSWGRFHREHERAEAAERVLAQARDALQKIAEWDCLNPPATHLVSDLAWLKNVVDAALSGSADTTETA